MDVYFKKNPMQMMKKVLERCGKKENQDIYNDRRL